MRLTDNINKYINDVSLIDIYITKHINKIVKNKKEYEYIKNNIYLLGITNKIGKNSIVILLENNNYKVVSDLITHNINILSYCDTDEKNVFQYLLLYEELHNLIIKILINDDINEIYKVELINKTDVDNNNFIDICINLILISGNEKNIDNLINILKHINNLHHEHIFILITKLCKNIDNTILLDKIIKQLDLKNIDIYPDENNYTCVDYLILNDKLDILYYLIDKINYIYFVNYDNITIFNLIDLLPETHNENIKYGKRLIELIFSILSKSNIYKIKDNKNNNLLLKLLKVENINSDVVKKYINYFDIFEQNIDGENIFNLLKEKYKNIDINKIVTKDYYVDSQINYNKTASDINNNNSKIIYEINFNLRLSKFLKKTNYGLFNSNAIHNMIYTFMLLKKNNNIMIPYYKYSNSEYLEDKINLTLSNNDSDILSIIKIYYSYFRNYLIHIIIWKDDNNYFIHNKLITWLNENKNKYHFIYIKLSIISANKTQGNIRHANIILIDNKKNIVERFEPYGEIYYINGIGINKMIENEIAKKLNYKFVFVQPYPGFQVKSNEINEVNKVYGDPAGYCLAWCFMYIEIKLYYENKIKNMNNIKNKKLLKIIDDNQIIKLINNYIINIFKNDFENLKNDNQQNLYMTFIRYYGKRLDNFKNKLMKAYNIDISTIYHINLNNTNLKNITYKLNNDINKLTK